jgi:hypothetical protein
MSIATVVSMVLVSFFVIVPSQMPTVRAYATPGTGMVWNMDDLVVNSSGDVIGAFPNYVIMNDLTITGGLTPDTVFMRDGEIVSVVPGATIFVDGIFLSPAVVAPIEFRSALAVPEPQDWVGFEFRARSIGRFLGTIIRHADTGLSITDASVIVRSSFVEECYPTGIRFDGGLLYLNNTDVYGSSPPSASLVNNGGRAIYATGVVTDTLWINQSTIVGGNGFPQGQGGDAIFTINLDGPIGLFGNDRIQGGSGGYNNVDAVGAGGGGGIGFHAFPVFDMGPQPSINISRNTLIRGGNGGLNNATLDASSGRGGQGIIISDNDYIGTVAVVRNGNISGGDGGDNFANWGMGFTVGNGGPGIVLDNVGGMPSRIAFNTGINGGKGGNNSGASMMGGAVAGWGGVGINLNDVRDLAVRNNTVMGGHGGNNTLTGMGVIAGQGGVGIVASLAQNLTIRGSNVYGGHGGDDYAGQGPGMMSGPGNGGNGIRSTDNLGNVIESTVIGGKGGDNFGTIGEGRVGGYGVFVSGTLSPIFSDGVFTGGKGGDNYNATGNSAGQGNYAFYIDAPQRVGILTSEVSGGAGGDCYDGFNAIPGNGMSGIGIIGAAFATNIAGNSLITVGAGGTHYLTGAVGAKGSFGIEIGLPPTMVMISSNYIYNASFSGIYSQAPGVLVQGNIIEANWMGVYLEPTANWMNITDNPMIGGGFAGINAVQADNLLIRNNLINETDIGIALMGCKDVLVDRTVVNDASTWAIRFQTYADRILVENSTITNSLTWDFSANLWSNATTLNTTFDGGLVDLLPNTRLTVKNYLDVKVLDNAISPLPNADIEVLDNAAQIYATPFYGGVNVTTSASGDVRWITVTDRIYFGSNIATENVTDAQVEEGGKAFINNPRPVDMSTSHTEVFLEAGGDNQPPEIYNVLLDAQKFRTVTAGTIVGLAALLDDTLTGGSNITSANWTIGAANWPGSSMFPLVPPYDFPVEPVIDGIDTTLWFPGSYEIWVYGCDESLNCNTTGDFATLNVTAADSVPPRVNNVWVNGQPSISVVAGTLVDLTAVLDDLFTGDSDISSANYTIGQDAWPGIPMTPVDGTWNSSIEDVQAVVDTIGWAAGPYEMWVYGCDIIPNCNTTGFFATINIIPENIPPQIHSVTVNGLPMVSVPAGTFVTLNATVNDTLTGGSTILFANYTIGSAAWPGFGMFAVDGTWGDDVSEDVTMVVDTTGWGCGPFDLYVYGWDSVPNYNTTSTYQHHSL